MIISKLNTFGGLWDADSIYPGMVLKLPPKSVLEAEVQKAYNGILGDGR